MRLMVAALLSAVALERMVSACRFIDQHSEGIPVFRVLVPIAFGLLAGYMTFLWLQIVFKEIDHD